MVGERQPELFVPNQSGVIMTSVPRSGGFNVEVNNYADVDVQPQRVKGPDGRDMLRLEIKRLHGDGSLDADMARYGVAPKARRRG